MANAASSDEYIIRTISLSYEGGSARNSLDNEQLPDDDNDADEFNNRACVEQQEEIASYQIAGLQHLQEQNRAVEREQGYSPFRANQAKLQSNDAVYIQNQSVARAASEDQETIQESDYQGRGGFSLQLNMQRFELGGRYNDESTARDQDYLGWKDDSQMRTELMLHQNDGGLNNLLGPSNMDVETARGPDLDDFGDRLGEPSQELCLRTDRSITNDKGAKYSPSPNAASRYDDGEELKMGERMKMEQAEARMRRSLDQMLNESQDSLERVYDAAPGSFGFGAMTKRSGQQQMFVAGGTLESSARGDVKKDNGSTKRRLKVQGGAMAATGAKPAGKMKIKINHRPARQQSTQRMVASQNDSVDGHLANVVAAQEVIKEEVLDASGRIMANEAASPAGRQNVKGRLLRPIKNKLGQQPSEINSNQIKTTQNSAQKQNMDSKRGPVRGRQPSEMRQPQVLIEFHHAHGAVTNPHRSPLTHLSQSISGNPAKVRGIGHQMSSSLAKNSRHPMDKISHSIDAGSSGLSNHPRSKQKLNETIRSDELLDKLAQNKIQLIDLVDGGLSGRKRRKKQNEQQQHQQAIPYYSSGLGQRSFDSRESSQGHIIAEGLAAARVTGFLKTTSSFFDSSKVAGGTTQVSNMILTADQQLASRRLGGMDGSSLSWKPDVAKLQKGKKFLHEMNEAAPSQLTQQATDQKVLPPLKSKPNRRAKIKDHMLDSGDGGALMVNLASIGQIKRLPPSLAQQSTNAQQSRRVVVQGITNQNRQQLSQIRTLKDRGMKKRKMHPPQGRHMMQIANAANASPGVLHSGESDGGAPFKDGHSSSLDHQYSNLAGGRVQGRFQSSLPPQRDGFNASVIQGSGDRSLQRVFRGTHGPFGNLPQQESFNQKRRSPVAQTSEDEFEQFDRDLDNEVGLSPSQAQTHKQGQLSSLIVSGDDLSSHALSPARNHIDKMAANHSQVRSSVQRIGAVNNMSVAPVNEAAQRTSQQMHTSLLAGSSLNKMEGTNHSPQKSFKNSGLSQVSDKPPKIKLGKIGATGPSQITDRLTQMFENNSASKTNNQRGGVAALYSRRVSVGSGQKEAANVYDLPMPHADGTQESGTHAARQFLTSSQRRERIKRPSIAQQFNSPNRTSSRKGATKEANSNEALGDAMRTPISSRDMQPWPVEMFSGMRHDLNSGGRMAFANQTDGFVPAQQTRPLVSRGGNKQMNHQDRGGTRGKVNNAQGRRDSGGFEARDLSTEQIDEFGLPMPEFGNCEPSPNARQHRPRIGGRQVNQGIQILSLVGGEPIGAGLQQQSNSKFGNRNSSIGAMDNAAAREDPSSLRTPFRVQSRRQGSRRGEGSGDKHDANWASRLLASQVAEHGRPPNIAPTGNKYAVKEDRPQTRGNHSRHGGVGGTAGGARSVQRSRRLPGRPVALKAISPAEGGTSESINMRGNVRGMGSFEAQPRQADPDEFGPPLHSQMVTSPGNDAFQIIVPEQMIWSNQNMGQGEGSGAISSTNLNSPKLATPGRSDPHNASRNRKPLPASSESSNKTKVLSVSQVKFAPGAKRPARANQPAYDNQAAVMRPNATDLDGSRQPKQDQDGNAVTGGEYRSNVSKDRLPSGVSINNGAPNMGSSSEGGAPQHTGASTGVQGSVTASSKRTSQHMYAQQYGLINSQL